MLFSGGFDISGMSSFTNCVVDDVISTRHKDDDAAISKSYPTKTSKLSKYFNVRNLPRALVTY